MSDSEVVHNIEKQRFEVALDSGTAVLEYRRREREILFTHTEVPDSDEDRGIGTRMAHAALEFARENKLEVVPLCQFVASYVKRHPEYMSIVSPRHRERLMKRAG